jgi:hypothetical protein
MQLDLAKAEATEKTPIEEYLYQLFTGSVH